jgi:hypothetical protein
MSVPIRACRPWRGPLAAILALAMPLAQAADDREARQHAALLQALVEAAREDFAVPPTLTPEEPLRQRLQALSSEHIERVRERLTAWADDLRGGATLPPAASLGGALRARYLNAQVAWQIDRLDDADDARLLKMMARPLVCGLPGAETGFGRWAHAVQRLPEAEREAAVQAQAALLARWGKPVTTPPVRPDAAWLPEAQAALVRVRAFERAADEPPAPPALIWLMRAGPRERAPATLRCGLMAWNLQRAAYRTAPVAEQARAVRFALAWDPVMDVDPGKPESPDDDYPIAARSLGVEGTIRVAGRVTAAGTGLDGARVVGREVQVEGLGATLPIAFEAVFDAAALRRAARTPTGSRAAGTPHTLEFVWRLK